MGWIRKDGEGGVNDGVIGTEMVPDGLCSAVWGGMAFRFASCTDVVVVAIRFLATTGQVEEITD